jgi:hypothetical protein
MQEAYLGSADLQLTRMENADLKDTCLIYADMKYANFCGADLSSSHMEHTVMMDTSMENACLRGTNLTEADVKKSMFYNADFTGAVVSDKTESLQHVFDTDNVRVFINDTPYKTDAGIAFYSQEDKETKACTVILDTDSGQIEMNACRSLGQDKNIRDVAYSIFKDNVTAPDHSRYDGCEKHYAIAGAHTCDRARLGIKDLADTVMEIEKTISPPACMDRVEELQGMQTALKAALESHIQEKELIKNEPAKLAWQPEL